MLNDAAEKIVSKGMAAPAILALELHKPVANVMAHTALTFSGFIAPIVGAALFDDLTRLLSKRDNVERLIVAIEERQQEAKS